MERVLNGWFQMARQLAIPGHDVPDADIFQLLQDHMSDDVHCQWLLVLDNADDEDVLFKSATRSSPNTGASPSRNLVSSLPRSKDSSILITTRDRRLGEKLASKNMIINVSSLTTAEALHLLRSKLPSGIWEEASAVKLVADLDYLPLAITQAAALISQNSTTIADYLESLHNDEAEAKELLDEEYYDVRRDQDIQTPVLRTWRLSFDMIQKQKTRAIEILSLMAVMDRQGIPKRLLKREGESAVHFTLALGILQAFSLISTEKEGLSFGIHRLVQLSVEAKLESEGNLAHTQAEALDNLVRETPDYSTFDSWGEWEVIMPHMEALLRCRPNTDLPLLQQAWILRAIALYDREQGRYSRAQSRLQEALDIRQRILGKEAPAVMFCLTEQGFLMEKMGQYAVAEDLHRRAYEGRVKVLGEEHPHTLQSLNNLGGALWWQGKAAAAKEKQQLGWELRKKTLGHDHHDTLKSLGDLAVTHEDLGDWDVAEEMLRRVLAITTEKVGESHAETVGSMRTLASILQERHKYAEAEKMFRQALLLKVEAVGTRHVDATELQEYLAGCLYWQDKNAEAELLQRQIWHIRSEVLPANHPSTLNSMQLLCGILEAQGKYEESELLLRQLVERRTSVLGKGHRHTLSSKSRLATALEIRGDFLASEEMHLQVLTARARSLGHQHPDTLSSMDNLAGVLWTQDKRVAATEMRQKVLAARQAAQGKDHPETLASLDSVIGSLWGLERLAEATEVLREALKLREERYGEEDPETLVRITRLAYLVRIQGQKDEAIEL